MMRILLGDISGDYVHPWLRCYGNTMQIDEIKWKNMRLSLFGVGPCVYQQVMDEHFSIFPYSANLGVLQ